MGFDVFAALLLMYEAQRWLGQAVCGVLVGGFAFGMWYHAFGRFLPRPRPVTVMLVLVGLLSALSIALVEQHPFSGFIQPALMIALPLVCALTSAARFPDGVPARDVDIVNAFFVFVTAASAHQLTVLWQRTEHECPPALRLIRRSTMALSTMAVLAHATWTWLRRCEAIWCYSRAAFAFAGGLRLLAAVAIRATGEPLRSDSYPPTSLTFPASLAVNTSYVMLALLLTPKRRRSFASAIARTLAPCANALPSPLPVGNVAASAMSGGAKAAAGVKPPALETDESDLCAVCMSGRKDHAFISCGHICTCATCAHAILEAPSPTCPFCRNPVSGSLRTYRV